MSLAVVDAHVDRATADMVVLFVLASQTKSDWSLAPVEAGVDGATHDMGAQCGAGGEPKLDLLSAHTRL